MLKLATLFSGIGAVEHALERIKVPYELVFACDIDPFCKQTFFANYKITEDKWFADVTKLDGKPYKNKVDLLMGGSPCQSFSMVGKRKGFNDHRGNLFFEFTRLVKEIRPKVFIFENVKGLTTNNKQKTWEIIKKEFDSTGYSWDFKVLNARDYGIPQNRERVFVVGFRDGKTKPVYPKPVKLDITMKDLLEDNPDSKYFLPKKGVAFVTSQKNLTKRYTQINGDVALCEKANQQFNWHGDFIVGTPKDVDKKYFLSEKVKKYVLESGTKGFYSKPEIDLDIARPLLSTMAKMHRAGVDNYISRKEGIRKLTPRECLRLMGFSDSFKIVVSDTQAYKQAGNSIVVNVLMHLLKSIKISKYAARK